MKTRAKTALALLMLLAGFHAATAQPRYVTLTVNADSSRGSIVTTNELRLGAGDTAELVTTFTTPGARLDWIKDDKQFEVAVGYITPASLPLIVAGPAVLRLSVATNQTHDMPSLITFKIIPESFPPDKTLIIPQGTAGATVVLESSTNLIQWTTATNGFYTGTNAAVFFRIRAERAP